MNDPQFKKIQDAILVPVLAILSGLVVMGDPHHHLEETSL